MAPPNAISFADKENRGSRRPILTFALSSIFAYGLACAPTMAETISGALARAYAFSPDLNQQRAGTRAQDETVPGATAAWRPTVSGTAQASDVLQNSERGGLSQFTHAMPRSYGVTVTQTIYNGGRTLNGVRRAESGVFQSRENLRNGEQSILYAAATAYMDVLLATATLKLQQNNVEVLQEQLKQTQDRFQVGEVTRTDVAQSQAALSQGQAAAFTAQSTLQTKLAIYRQLIGTPPHNLEPARPLEALLPRSLDEAVALAQSEHPAIQAALHAVDAAALNVKIQEGALYPTVSVQGSLTKTNDTSNVPGYKQTTATALANLTVPFYDGGSTYAGIRQAKEQLGQARLVADQQRELVRAQVVSTWGTYQNTKFVIQAYLAQVRANEIALNGVREEAKVGQRTTLDVLNAQQTLLSSRVNLIQAQHDQVVNSYGVLTTIGRLTAQNLGLNVVAYDPTIHFDQVKDKWWGVRTPDGR